MSNCRRGPGEKGKGGEGARDDGWQEGFQHCDDCGRGCRGRGLDDLYGYVRRGAERAVGVGVGSVGMGVGDLCCAGYDDQKNAEQREEESPRTLRSFS